jgi:toxin ParE1/3/4
MRVRYSARARQDLRDIFAYIQLDDPAAAEGVPQRVDQRVGGLADFPRQGRPASAGRRELVIAGMPYLAVYRIVGDEVQVVRILHGRQRRS